MAETYNLTIDQGATWYQTVTYKDANGNPINLTGYSAALQLRTSYSAASASLSISTSTTGITIPTPANGTIVINVPAVTTAALIAQDYVYDLEITSGTGVVTRLIQGTAVVSPEATR